MSTPRKGIELHPGGRRPLLSGIYGMVLATWLAVAGATPAVADTVSDQSTHIEQQLSEIRAMRAELARQISALDSRIGVLEAELQALPLPLSTSNETVLATSPARADRTSSTGPGYEPGRGLVLATGDLGEVDFSVFTYVRYLNQDGLADSYTDSFGRTRPIDPRQDIQLQKVTLNLKGWLLDERFRYLFYIWTANTSQGQDSQVVVGGNMSYNFSRHLTLGAGIGSRPSTRTTNNTFPNWLKVDHRTLADEFFRGSFTTGIWASGDVTDRMK